VKVYCEAARGKKRKKEEGGKKGQFAPGSFGMHVHQGRYVFTVP